MGFSRSYAPAAAAMGLFLLMPALVGCAGSSYRADPNLPIEANLRAFARQGVEQQGLAGISGALVSSQGVIASFGVGVADPATGRPADADTLYWCGSLTKPVTAMVVMAGVERGEMTLDTPLADIVYEFSMRGGADPAITPRSLLTHHAGVPTVWRARRTDGSRVPFDGIAAELADVPAVVPPWSRRHYSTVGYNLLGHAAQRAAGDVPFARLAEQRLFQPAGMTTATFDLDQARPQLAAGMRGGQVIDADPDREGDLPGGGLFASVSDLAQVIQLVLNDGVVDGRRVLEADTVREMLRPQNEHVVADLDVRAGLGWSLTPKAGLHHAGRIAYHGGATWLHRSLFLISLDHDLGLVVASNSADSRESLDEVALVMMRTALAHLRDVHPQGPEPQPTPLVRGDPTGEWQAMIGPIFVSPSEPGSGRHKARLFGRDVYLTPREPGLWGVEYRLFGLFKLPIAALEPLRFGVQTGPDGARWLYWTWSGVRELVGAELPPPGPISPVWRDMIGDYVVMDPGAREAFGTHPQLKLREKQGRLVADFRARLPFEVDLEWIVIPRDDHFGRLAGATYYLGGEPLLLDPPDAFTWAGVRFEKVDAP